MEYSGCKRQIRRKECKRHATKIFLAILSEIKTSAKISCTGFSVFQNSAKQGRRGGVALLMKPIISKYLENLDKSYENVISRIIYHPRHTIHDGSKMSNLNSRVGIPINLSIRKEICECEGVEDRTVNKNAKCVLDLCEDNKLVVVNNLKQGTHHFK